MRRSYADPPEFSGQPQFAMPPLTRAVKTLIIANAAVFAVRLLVFLLPFEGAERFTVGLQNVFGIHPQKWIDWFPFLPVWQLVTWGFLHDVRDPMHILINMLMLYFLGTMLEGIVGSRRFYATYFGALLVSGAITLLVGLLAGDQVPTLGASGAVLCVVVATAVLRPQTRIIFLLFPITLRTLAIFLVGIDLFYLLLQLKGMDTGVARLAHLSGAAWGYVLVRSGWIWRDPVEAVQATHERRQDERRQNDEQRLDELLGKIKREGIHSLSLREKAFLKRVSKRR